MPTGGVEIEDPGNGVGVGYQMPPHNALTLFQVVTSGE